MRVLQYPQSVKSDGWRNLKKKTMNFSSRESLNERSAAAVAKGLKVNTAVQTLEISNNKLDDKCAAFIAEAIKIDLDKIDAGAQAIGEALKINKTLQTLSINLNSIGAQGAEHIAEALKANQTLRELHLGYNDIDADSATCDWRSLR
eukprot:g876.t1